MPRLLPSALTAAAGAIDARKTYGVGDAARPRPRRRHGLVRARSVHARSWGRRVAASRRCCTASQASTRLTGGAVFIGDTYLAELNDKQLTELRRTQVGFVFQAFNLIPTLTARENIMLPLMLGGDDGDTAWIERVIDTVGLADRLTPPTERALGWPAAARRRRTRARQSADDHLRRRADRQPRLELGRRDPDVHARGGRRVRSDDRDGHPRSVRRRTSPIGQCSSPTARSCDDMSDPTADEDHRSDEADRSLITMIGTLARKSLRARLGRSIFIGLAILAGVSFVCRARSSSPTA